MPFILSPTAEKHHHPHSDESATSPAQSTGSDYSVPECTDHIYSCLEGPEPSVVSSEKEIGQGQPTGTEGEYSSIEPK